MLFDQGIQRGAVQFPRARGADAELPGLTALRDLGKLKALRARSLAAQNRWDDAAQELAGLESAGEMISRRDALLIQYLVGLSLRNLACNEMAAFAAHDVVPDSALKILSDHLAQASDPRTSLISSLAVEFDDFYLVELGRFAAKRNAALYYLAVLDDLAGTSNDPSPKREAAAYKVLQDTLDAGAKRLRVEPLDLLATIKLGAAPYLKAQDMARDTSAAAIPAAFRLVDEA
ncbi:MAG: hypothetical protein IT444_10885 [Phycisphaeraceae bacterium]|nr:hypothetical protein [Phycisphaeraceae bacterium]